jgi:hypothetical protein
MQSRQFSGLVKSPVVGRLSTLDYLLRSSLDFSSMSLPNVFLTLFSELQTLLYFLNCKPQLLRKTNSGKTWLSCRQEISLNYKKRKKCCIKKSSLNLWLLQIIIMSLLATRYASVNYVCVCVLRLPVLYDRKLWLRGSGVRNKKKVSTTLVTLTQQ